MDQKTRGAISVFLVMILVPCIVVTSLFVDLGRVHMSKSMANSASDLALNSLLTNYDADLNEWYGMVASCQSIEEFYEASAQFFLRTLSSQGLSDDEIILISDYYANATNDDTIYDFLQSDCLTAPSDMIKAVDGANLSNATMLKDEIVEFMKYRGPIEITLGLIERLKNDTTVSDAIESDENTDHVENKTAYYEAEGDLLAAAFNTYVAIYDFYRDATTKNLTNDQLKNYANKLTSYKNVYLEIHKLMITNLFNTSGLTKYSRIRLKLDKYNTTYTKQSSEVNSRKVGDVYYIDGDRITSLLDTLDTEISDFEAAKTNFVNVSSSLMSKLPGTSSSESNAIQWWVQMNNAVNASSGTNRTSEVKTASENMLKAYSKVLAIKDCELGNDIPDDWESKFDELTGKVISLHRKYIVTTEEINSLQAAGETVTIDYTDSYNKTVKKLEEVSAANENNTKASNIKVTVDGQNLSLDQALAYIKSNLTSMRSDLQALVDDLDIAIDGNGDDVKSLDELTELARQYNTSFLAWEASANENDTFMKQFDKKAIKGTLTGAEANLNVDRSSTKINDSSVAELKTRLVNIRSQLKTVIFAIDSLEYGGSKVKNISTYSSFETAARTKVVASNIKLTNQELLNYANSSFAELFNPTGSTVLTIEHLSDAKYNPKIDPVTKDVQTPELFVYFHSKFQGASKQNVEEKQKELDDSEKEGNNATTQTKDKGRYHSGGSDITKDFSGSGIFNLADGTYSGLLDLFESLLNSDITSIRDDLYVTEYIMQMFSYATYEEEGLYSLAENKTSLYLPTSGYRPTEYSNYLGAANTEKTWLSENLEDSYNKSLTNKMINKGNNVAYGAEVEYILYGGRDGKGNADNVKSVYSNIYEIRYAMNLVSGFANFWSPTKNSTAAAIEAVARAIQLATSGIIPASVTKVVVIPILTAFETSKDLDRLEAGFPVELYKSSGSDWWIKVPDGSSVTGVGGLTSIFKGAFNGPNTDKGIYYSDYLTVFVYLGLKSSSAEAMYQRMAEVIQANMRGLTGQAGYSMKKAQLYFQLKAQIRVKPLMIALPFFNDYNNNMDTKTDWCTYEINTTLGYS